MGRHGDHGIGWRALAFYGITSALVLIVASLALHFFFERQSLRGDIAPEPLPSVVLVSEREEDPLAAAWVTQLTEADFAPSLVTPQNLRETDGLLVLCNITSTAAPTLALVEKHIKKGGGLILIGSVPEALRPLTGMSTEPGVSGTAIKVGETISPVLARVHPGHEIGLRAGPVATLVEGAETVIDARWRENARAVVAHRITGASRVVWLGFDPSRLHTRGDRHLGLMLRTAMRWAAGQPVSDGASGTSATVARTLAPAARVESRAMRLTFSVDRLQKPGLFSVRIMNKGKLRLNNPTVQFWLPPGTKHVELMGSLISRRSVSLIPVDGEGAVLITLPSLAPNEERVMRLRATK